MAPWTLVMGHLPRGPLAILIDSWCDQELPISFGTNAQEYLREPHDKLEVAKRYASSHSQREQQKYATRYNLRSKDKHSEVGEKVLILLPDSTASRTFSKWTGPATVLEVLSSYSYVVNVAGTRRRFHANKLRKNFMWRMTRCLLLILVLWCMRMTMILVILMSYHCPQKYLIP